MTVNQLLVEMRKQSLAGNGDLQVLFEDTVNGYEMIEFVTVEERSDTVTVKEWSKNVDHILNRFIELC